MGDIDISSVSKLKGDVLIKSEKLEK